jgi:sugar O-acyltransferase (sialic acid O-acetyltransferase NeuD family)
VSPRRIVLLGGGGHAAVVADALDAAGIPVAGYIDDRPGPVPPAAAPHRGGFDPLPDLDPECEAIHAATGDPDLRRRWLRAARRRGLDIVTVVHPAAVVAASALLGRGAFVGPRAVVNARARIGPGAIVNTAAVVEHDAVVGAFAHIGPTAVLAGGVRIGRGALVGMGALVLPGRVVGRGAVIGAGAVVTRDVPAEHRALGAPARATPLVPEIRVRPAARRLPDRRSVSPGPVG